jgi:hypothetical protein
MEVKLPTFAFEKRAEDEHVQFQVTSYNYEDHACKPFDESLHGVYENGGNYTSRQESLREESAPAVSVLQLFGRTKFNVSVCIHVEIWHSLVLQYPSNLQRWEFDGVTSYIANKLHYCMKEISFHLSMHHRLFDCPRRVDDSSQLQVFPFLHIRCKSKKVYNRVKALFWNFKIQAKSFMSWKRTFLSFCDSCIAAICARLGFSRFQRNAWKFSQGVRIVRKNMYVW